MCKGCVLGKQVKAAFPSRETKSKGVLDLVCFDIYAPMLAEYISGRNYFVTIIDDYSKRAWICFLKTKDEVFSRF